MARRNGKPGQYLMSDDYTGVTEYASKLQLDYWGNWTRKPLIRNLQEVASPLNDPLPVSIFRGPQYEQTSVCDFETQPLFIGTTNRRTPDSFSTNVLGFDPGVGEASISCTFIVH